MRVAFIHPFLYRYARGIERFTVNLANALAGEGVEAHILTWRWPQPVELDVLDPRVRVRVMPTARYYAAHAVVPFYAWALWTGGYDFAWIAFADYGEAAALRLAPRQRFGVVFHYPFAQVPQRYRAFARSGLAQRARAIVAVSGFVADGVRAALGRESTVIQHGVDTARFTPDGAVRATMRQALGVPADAPLLLTAAALEERKGVQWVLRSLPAVLAAFPGTTYVVLGEGGYRPALEALARDLGIARAVRFLGAQADVVPWYQAADLSLILARGEASSLAALESLACAVPVVAADRRPFDELITPACGLQVPEEDSAAVAGAILGLLGDAPARLALGQAGRRRILADFRWDVAARHYHAVMHGALAERRGMHG